MLKFFIDVFKVSLQKKEEWIHLNHDSFQCKKTLEASNFAKAQLKKFKKNRPCFCLQCSRNKGGGKADIKVGASSSGGSAGKGVCTRPIVECISFE